jgi:hypothetical protein
MLRGLDAQANEFNRAAWQGSAQSDLDRRLATQQMYGAMMGTAPSAAQSLYATASDKAMGAQIGMAQAASGANRSLAMRDAATNTTMAGQEVAGNLAAMRAQEMAVARQQYGDYTAGQRGQELQAYYQNQGQNDAWKAGLMAQGTDRWLGGMQSANAGRLAETDAQRQANEASKYERWITTGLGAVGSGVATLLSDRAAKTDVKKSGSELDEFLNSLSAYSYKYKKDVGEDPDKKRYGIMVQDLEKSRVGKSLVRGDHPSGYKAVDAGQAALLSLAVLSRLAKRVQKVEGRK